MGQENFVDERWLISENATQSQNDDEEDEEEEEEALSLSDLPLIHQWRKENRSDENNNDNNNNDSSTREDEEFDFCSHSKESEMCAADELFFKGQILPLRHSVSSEKGSLLQNYDGGGGGYRRRSISRSDSMDHYYSSRSSSMSSSHQSSSSGSSSATARRNPKLPPRIHFHTHPSPSPRLHFPSSRHGGAAVANHRNSIKKSSIWNVLRLGLVTTPPPEITFQDLKARSGNSSSRNSTGSNSSGGASMKKKMRPRILSGGGCKCAAADAVAPRVVIIKRSASEGDVAVGLHDRSSAEKRTIKAAAKKHLSQHRTFEWLKQLSVEATAAAADQS